MSKSFYVITETEWNWENTEFKVIYAFDNWEEADQVCTLLNWKNKDSATEYDLHTVNNQHPFTEEQMKTDMKQVMSQEEQNDREGRSREKLRQKQLLEERKEREKQRKKEEEIQDRQYQLKRHKQQLDEFLEWLHQPRPEEQMEQFLIEAHEKRNLLQPILQDYLLENKDPRFLELLEKPMDRLLGLQVPSNQAIKGPYIPQRLRDLLHRPRSPSPSE